MTKIVCSTCGGKLVWLNLPNEVYAEGSKPKEPITYTPIQICSKCGRYVRSEAIERLPTLEQLQNENRPED
jgi:DNA-directed RNA polymerase subunit RPC12/RpoP